MVNQMDIANPQSPDRSDWHGNIDDDEFEEYTEEEILSDEESNEDLCEEQHNDLCINDSNVEDLHEDSKEEVFEEDPTEGAASEEDSEGSSEEDLMEDVSCEEIIEEETSEEAEKEPNEKELLKGSMDQPLRFPVSENAPDSSSNQCLMNPKLSSTDANVFNNMDVAGNSSKKRHSRWDIKPDTPLGGNDGLELGKKRKTRWSSDETPSHPLDTPKLPDSVLLNLPGMNNQGMQKLYAKLQVINQKLEKYDDSIDNMIDTMEFRHRSKLIEQKHKIVTELLNRSKRKKSKRTKKFLFSEKLYVPVKEYPNYNFIGLILGPRGNSLKAMATETGAQLKLRGRGAHTKEKRIRLDENEDLHVLIEADEQTSVDAAVEKVGQLLIPVHDGRNYYKAAQLRELAVLNGTLKGGMYSCDVCGSSSHRTTRCPLTATAARISPNFPSVSGSLFSSFVSQKASPSPLPLEINKDSHFSAVSGSSFSSFTSQNVSPIPLAAETKKQEGKPDQAIHGFHFPAWSGNVFSSFRSPIVSPNLLPSETKKHEEKPKEAIRASNIAAASGSSFSSLITQVTFPRPLPSETKKHDEKPKKVIDDCNVFVGCLPYSVTEYKLMELFLPYGKLHDVKLLKNRKTGQSNGCGFIKYATREDAAKAIAHMNGYSIEGRRLAVRVAGIPPPSTNPSPYPGPANIPQQAPPGTSCPGPTGSLLPAQPISFPKSSYNASNNIQTAAFQSPATFGSTFQASSSFSQGFVPVSGELATFPGFLKSLDPPNQTATLGTLTSLTIPVSSELASFPGFLKSIDPPVQNLPLGSSTSFVSAFQPSTLSSPISSNLVVFPDFPTSSNPTNQLFQSSMPSSSSSFPRYFSRNPFGNQSHPTGR